MRPSEILAQLQSLGFEPKRSLGQHFLLDPSLLSAVADAGDVGPEDAILEVGTGPGTLTRVLAARAALVITVEMDRKIQAVAKGVLAAAAAGEPIAPADVGGEAPGNAPGRPAQGRVQFVTGDVLDGPDGLNAEVVDALRAAAAEGLRPKCVSNFPYSVSTPLFVRLLERSQVERAFPLHMIAGMVQREAAQRLTAQAITKEYGAPSVLVQALAKASVTRRVGPKAFHPPPKVDSAIVRIEPGRGVAGDRGIDPSVYARFRDLVRAVFQQRRKTLRNALVRGAGVPPDSADVALATAGVDPDARVEQLSVVKLLALAAALPLAP